MENIKVRLEKEEKNLLINLMNFFFSAIPALINVISKWWEISGESVVLAASVPINALGFFSVGSFLTSTLEKIFKSIPDRKGRNKVEFGTNIVFIIIYSFYFVIVPVCFFTGIESRIVTGFSLFTILLRTLQTLISVLINIANITRIEKKVAK